MAYMNQERKAIIAAKLKEVMPKGWKYSLGVRSHSTIVLTITSAPVDLMAEAKRVAEARQAHMEPYLRGNVTNATHLEVNHYHPHKQFDVSLPVFERIIAVLNEGNHDRSVAQADYFDVGWYVNVNVGRWDKPFTVK